MKSKFMVIVEAPISWNTNQIMENIEEEFPGWKVSCVAFLSDALEHEVVASVACDHAWILRDREGLD